MGTNYYWHTNICEHCKRTDVLHVGKKSRGWTFHFRGYRIEFGADQEITSVEDWAKVFKVTQGKLINEHDQIIENPLQFLADLERPTLSQQEDEDSPDRRGAWAPRPDPRYEWRDAEGFAFYDGEFS